MNRLMTFRGFCPSKASAQRFRARDPTHTTKHGIFGVGSILFVILIARAWALIDFVTAVTWVIFSVTMVMFYYIRKLALKLVRVQYDVYTIMAEIEERDKAKPAHVFTTPVGAITHFLKLFYINREKIKLTTSYDIDPVSLQEIGEDEGFIIERLDAEQLAMRLTEKYPNLVLEICIRSEKPDYDYLIARH